MSDKLNALVDAYGDVALRYHDDSIGGHKAALIAYVEALEKENAAMRGRLRDTRRRYRETGGEVSDTKELCARLRGCAGPWSYTTLSTAAADAIEALEAERDAALANEQAMMRTLEDVLADRSKDEERYRWLRNTPPWESPLAVTHAPLPDDVVYLFQKELDAAIDAALEKQL